MVGRGDTEIHRIEFHSLRVCDQCQVSIEAFKLPEHKVKATAVPWDFLNDESCIMFGVELLYKFTG